MSSEIQRPTDASGTRPLRIAVVADAVYPWNTGGKEMRIEELMQRVARRGTEVDIYTMRWWPGSDSHHRGNLTYRAISAWRPLYSGRRRSIRQAIGFCLGTWRLLRHTYDVLDADSIPFLQLVPLALIARIRRRPLVVTWHEFWGRDYWLDYLGRLGVIAALIERCCLYLPDRIVAASQGTADRIQTATSGKVQPTVIPNGVDLTELTEVVESLPARRAAGKLLFVGRLLSHKNADVAIAATKELRRRGHQVQLSVIGEGPEAESLQLAAGSDLGTTISIRPFIADRSELLAEIAAADVLLFPSVREGFGMVALESMALGTPVVSSDHPDNYARLLISSGVDGEICSPEPTAVADAVAACLADLSARSAAARSAASHYVWDDLADRLVELYRDECVNDRPHATAS